MKRASLYNHNKIGDEKTPLIPNIIFKSLMWLIENKFDEEAEYIVKNYTLTEFQTQTYKNLKNLPHEPTLQ